MLQKKKKIAFVLTRFVVGGVEKSFLDLYDIIDKDRYDVTVFLPDDEGEWTSLLQKKCNVRFLRIENYKTVILSQLKRLQLFGVCRSVFFRILAKLNFKRHYRKSTEYFIRSMPRIREKFDCVAAYQIINDDCVLGSIYRLNAPRKVVWTHLDMNKTEPEYGKWYSRFDKIFCVSKYSQDSFVRNFPSLESKTEVLYNVICPDSVIQNSNACVALEKTENDIILVTVARLAAVKGQTIIPRAARILLDKGYRIKWYLVGDGDLRDEIENEIEKQQVKDTVILLGNQDNPYPYMKACDIYVQTSLVEGWGLTVSEAKILYKPIVTTDAGVMSEQIETGVNGIIVPDNTPETLAIEIGSLIDNPDLRERFTKQLQQEDVCHQGEIEKLYAVIEQ